LKQMLGERDEALQQALDFIQQSAKRWHNRLTFNNLRFAERYIKGELELFVLLKRGGVSDEQFGARLQRIPDGGSEVEHRNWQVLCPVRQPAKSRGSVESNRLIATDGRNQQAMFVDDIKPIDEPEVFAIPSSVRLERADRLQELLGSGWHLSLRHGLEFFQGRDVVPTPNWKGHPGDIWRVGVGGIGKVVKAGPDGVNSITEDERDDAGNRGDFIPDLGDSLSPLRIILGDDWIGIGPKVRGDLRFEVVDVLFRTIELQPGAVEVGHAVTSSSGADPG
jgi:hypothetical protein